MKKVDFTLKYIVSDWVLNHVPKITLHSNHMTEQTFLVLPVNDMISFINRNNLPFLARCLSGFKEKKSYPAAPVHESRRFRVNEVKYNRISKND